MKKVLGWKKSLKIADGFVIPCRFPVMTGSRHGVMSLGFFTLMWEFQCFFITLSGLRRAA
jgi:hypothetical protein